MSGCERFLLVAVLGVACVSPRERSDVLGDLNGALASDAIVVRGEGLPLDESAAPAGELAPAQALWLALHASPALQAALARVRQAEAEADLASAWPNPVLDLVLRAPSGGGRVELEAGLATGLLDILTRPRRASTAEDRLAEAAAHALTTALDVASEAQKAYLLAQSAEARLALARERRRVLDELAAAASARFAAGDGTRFDQLVLEGEALAAGLEVARHEAERRRARLGLALVLGEPSGALEWALTELAQPAPSSLEEGDAVARALAARPELEARRWSLSALGTELGLARSEIFAGTALGLDYERGEHASLGPSLSVPVPLFETGGARARRTAAALAAARSELVGLERAVVVEVRRACGDLAAARVRWSELEERVLPLARARREPLEQAYREGQVDVTALLLAEQAQQAAQAQRVELLVEWLEAELTLARALGPAPRATH